MTCTRNEHMPADMYKKARKSNMTSLLCHFKLIVLSLFLLAPVSAEQEAVYVDVNCTQGTIEILAVAPGSLTVSLRKVAQYCAKANS